jgi:hypothetical protein
MSQSTSDAVADPRVGRGSVSSATVALGLSLVAAAAWIAAFAADELYLAMAVFSVGGLVLGLRARRALGREAPGRGRALAAIIVSGTLIALFLAFLGLAIATGDF